MAQYATEQKKILTDFLRAHREESFSVEAIVDGMRAEHGTGIVPATSTVYRLMTKLVAEGTVKRFVRGNSRKFAYQIVMGEHCDCHLHLKCMGCGRLIHLDESVSDELLDKVKSISDFSVNEEATVLFGSCADCKKDKAEK